MYQKKRETDLRSPLEFGLDLFSAKWHSRIICELSYSYPLRFSQLRALLADVTDTALADALKKLIAHGIVQRIEEETKVEYSLTEKGWSVIPIFESICLWSARYYRPRETAALQKCQQCRKCLIVDEDERPMVLPAGPESFPGDED